MRRTRNALYTVVFAVPFTVCSESLSHGAGLCAGSVLTGAQDAGPGGRGRGPGAAAGESFGERSASDHTTAWVRVSGLLGQVSSLHLNKLFDC